jgi:ribose 5-phosphate isomerase B
MQTLIIGSDHGGYKFKQEIINYLKHNYENINLIDVGTHSMDSCDYPDIARELCTHEKLNKEGPSGILICGTGIGMSISANKFKGIRCALCHNNYTAKMARNHNNANILSIGARVISLDIAKEIVDIFLSESFEYGRHKRRVDKYNF